MRRFANLLDAFKLLLGLSMVVGGIVPARADEYLLAPQDKIRLLVYEWRSARAEVYAWTPLNSEFTVGPSGFVLLPFIGAIKAQDLNVDQLSTTIASALQDNLGLVARPSVSAEISQFRPVYVIGDVTSPGEFPYRPGLTVVRAMSLAGGLYRPAALSVAGLARDATVARGELRVMAAERAALVARRIRLRAEAAGADMMDVPKPSPVGWTDPIAAAATREEQVIFQSRAAVVKSRRENLAGSKRLLASEIQTLTEKQDSLSRQLKLAAADRNTVSMLAAKGLALSSRQISTEQTVSQLETALLDVGLALVRAKQSEMSVDQDFSAFLEQRRSAILQEERTVGDRLEELREKIMTNERLALAAEVSGESADSRNEQEQVAAPVYRITRAGASGSTEMDASAATAMQPGDVLQVRRQLPSSGRGQVSTPRERRLGQVSLGASAETP